MDNIFEWIPYVLYLFVPSIAVLGCIISVIGKIFNKSDDKRNIFAKIGRISVKVLGIWLRIVVYLLILAMLSGVIILLLGGGIGQK